ncbi:MAG TPA: hypothetical protein VHE54_07910 [Puia sp.]|nr:hypothetical protein [Puia sp.]
MAVEMGWLAADPTFGYRLSFEEKDPMRLEMEELNALVNKEIAIARLAEARDCYIFMCYMDMAQSRIGQKTRTRPGIFHRP